MNAKKLDGKLLTEFIETFYGYGEYSANYWLVGIEERGGKTWKDVETRLAAWKKRGKQELESDIAAFHAVIGKAKLFDEKPKYQPTWRKLTHLLFSLNDLIPDTEALRAYQKTELARDGCACWLDLLPLPSPNAKKWQYHKYSSLPILKKRALYENKISEKRAKHLQLRIDKYNPKAVIFYSITRIDLWEQVANVKFTKDKSRDLDWAWRGKTLLVVIKHPSTIGITNKYFQKVGEFTAKKIGRRSSTK